MSVQAAENSFDLIILGAGPAGLSTALHLLQMDPAWSGRMLVLEKAAHPRPKLCGGGLTRFGLQILHALGFTLPLPLPHARVDDIRLQYRQRILHVRGHPQIAIFHRPELDAWLAQQARARGANIHENVTVKSLLVDSQGVNLETSCGSYHARVVVGADGSRGLSRLAVQTNRGRTRVARLLEVIMPAPPDAPHFDQRYAWFDFTPVDRELQGYFWDFPTYVAGSPAFNRGVYDARLVSIRPRADLPGLLQTALHSLKVPAHSTEIAGHPIHWFSPRLRFAVPGLLLVGDAAGADPLFGEGIAPALGYGQVAAQAIQQAFTSQDFSFRDYRQRLLRSPVGRYLLLRWAVAEACYRMSMFPWFLHFVMSLGYLLTRIWPKMPDLYSQE